MPIQRTLTAEEYEEFPQEDKDLYTQAADGSYKLDVENVGALRRANERVKADKTLLSQEYEAMKEKLAKYESEKEAAEQKKQLDKEDIQKNDARWRAKYDKDLAEAKQQYVALQNLIKAQHRQKVIDEAVAETSAPQYKEIVRMLYDKRVDVEIDHDNVPRSIIKDNEGNVTSDTIKDLTKEFRRDKRYADILKSDPVGSGTVKRKKADDQLPPVGDLTGHQSSQRVFSGHPSSQRRDTAYQLPEEFDKINSFRQANPDKLESFTGPLPPEGQADY